jgi:tetratricopeptide (TPR) repeat protein
MRLARVTLAIAAAAVGLNACRGMSARPTKEREPIQNDFDHCYQAAKAFNNALQGSMDMVYYVDADGAVPFAWINDEKGLDSPQLNNCIMDVAVLAKFPAEGLDYLRPQGPYSFVGVSTMMPSRNEPPKAAMDEKLAQSTLEFADWASQTDKGLGYFHVHKYEDALKELRAATQGHPDDVRAWRGLASALAASGGDLAEAKAAAAKAIELKPDSEATHEAMLRVCIASKDDNCIYDEFSKARSAPDMKTRSQDLASLQDYAKAAADRLQGEDRAKQEAAAVQQNKEREERQKREDPFGCGKMSGDEQIVCSLRTCFDKGARAYADSLKSLTGQEYAAGEWKISKMKSGNSKVTVPIRSAAGGQSHDASWDVKMSSNGGLGMTPLDIDANNITQQHNACQK